jgi:hypothetical protein
LFKILYFENPGTTPAFAQRRLKSGKADPVIAFKHEHAFKRAPAERINLVIEEIGNLFILGPDSQIWKGPYPDCGKG